MFHSVSDLLQRAHFSWALRKLIALFSFKGTLASFLTELGYANILSSSQILAYPNMFVKEDRLERKLSRLM